MKRRRKISAAAERKIWGTIFISNWATGFLLFMAFPLAYSFYMSFNHLEILATGLKVEYRGLEHYRSILFENGRYLYDELIPFLRQSLIMIPVIVIFALLIAIMLNQKFAGRTVFRVIFFLPVIFTTGQIIEEFMAQGEGDIGFLERYNISYFVTQLFPGSWAAPIIAVLGSFVLVLWYSGVQILIFLAGRQTISGSIYEAARIDGATPWETFWKITLPEMVPFILLNSIYTVVDLFTFPTNPIIDRVNTTNYGLSSALAWIYFGIILAFLGLIFYIFSRITRPAKA
ncbi:carbohydrate ABC transporter permease [Paenibacillus alkalitolerans]|uniref:carbohydrate ABC transporter permease n=1 Tax=Paenibacillus alkalitolerans TaxID=2799335 RepID=UPI0018F2B658|nr:sugar ABC transporter permease [Paenibacillus alkalitolerans]